MFVPIQQDNKRALQSRNGSGLASLSAESLWWLYPDRGFPADWSIKQLYIK